MPMIKDPRTGELRRVNNQVNPRKPTIVESSNDSLANNADESFGNLTLFGTLAAKFVNFITRTGNKEMSRSHSTHNLRGSITNSEDSLLSPELQKLVNSTPEELEKAAKNSPVKIEELDGVKEAKGAIKSAVKKIKHKKPGLVGRKKLHKKPGLVGRKKLHKKPLEL